MPIVPSVLVKVPIPTVGTASFTLAELYPLPAFVILIDDIVPAADTIAFADAPTLI